MVAVDKGALLADLAETYHIFNYKELPCKTVALFSCELRDESRIKMKMRGQKVPANELLLASIADKLATLVWFGSQDGAKGINRPISILNALLGIEKESNNEVESFKTCGEFEKHWKEITEQTGVSKWQQS